jgi:hypothetical protein
MDVKSLAVLLGCLAFADPGMAQSPIVKLNGGLEATVLKVGRSTDHKRLTISLLIANKGSSTADLLMVGEPLATDNTGGAFKDFPQVSGIGFCQHGVAPTSYCIGIPEKVNWTVPLQSFTQVDPNVSITVNLVLTGQGEGPVISFSSQLYVRFVPDPLKDDTLPEAARYKQFRMMNLSFPAIRPTELE